MGQAQDNPIGMVRPLNVALNASGLGPADGSFGANDQLLVFNNAQTAFNKSPAATYYYDTSITNGSGWRKVGDSVPSTDHSADIIPMGAGAVIRKAQTGSGTTVVWNNSFPVQALSAVSRKVHGSAGTFDLGLTLNQQFNTLPGIEARAVGHTPAGTGIDHQIVFTFPAAISFTNIVTTSGAATVASFIGNNSTTVTVNLSAVSNAQKATITLLGANDGINANNVAVQIGLLAGDTTANGSVNSSDIAKTQSQSGLPVTSTNFLEDVTVNGSINSSDIALVQSKSGTGLP